MGGRDGRPLGGRAGKPPFGRSGNTGMAAGAAAAAAGGLEDEDAVRRLDTQCFTTGPEIK